jgi:DNA-binding transcriptional LysR family regulator
MEMHQIRYFLAVCEELNFTRAAQRCGVSQPSLTNAIKALERQLGGAVFRRKPRIALSQLGLAMRPYLEHIVQQAEGAREVARMLVPTAATAQAELRASRQPMPEYETG